MYIKKTAVKGGEEYILSLRSMYESFGYKKYSMSRFEEYDLYLGNKSFIQTGGIATVTDSKGRLLALKPDITLSIVRNLKNSVLPKKVYYSENVYNIDNVSGDILEQMQVGLEYIGVIDVRAECEVLLLAANSLIKSGGRSVIALSHMGLLSAVFDFIGIDEQRRELLRLLSHKNLHGIRSLCMSESLGNEATELLCSLAAVSGKLGEALPHLKELNLGAQAECAVQELCEIFGVIDSLGLSDLFMLDFSVVNDMTYYNGLVFQGFIDGIPKRVLSGGRYDNLAKKLEISAQAIGFAVYTDLLGEYTAAESEFDCDTLLVYNSSCSPSAVLKKQNELRVSGSVIAVCGDTGEIKYKKLIRLSEEE